MKTGLALALLSLTVLPAKAQKDVEAIQGYVGCVITNAANLAKGLDHADVVARTAESMCKAELQSYIATQPSASTEYRLALINAAERQALSAAMLEIVRQRAK